MRTLLFRIYQSGLCNQLLGLDVGIGLAHLMGRTFVPYGSSAPRNPRTADPRFHRVGPPHGGGRAFVVPPHHKGRVNEQGASTLLDFFDLPAPSMELGAWLDRGPWPGPVDLIPRREDGHLHWLHTVAWTDADPDGPAPEGFEQFAPDAKVRLGPSPRHHDVPVLRAESEALANAARVFLLSPERLVSLQRVLRRIEPKYAYRDFAHWLAERLGPYNAVHLRRTDFKKFLKNGTRSLTADELLDTMRRLFPRHERLVICTDESDDEAFFAPIRLHFRETLFLDHYILSDAEAWERFRALPRWDENALAVMTLLVAAESARFAGTMASTFTGWIHRRRMVTGRESTQYWAYNEYTHVPFEEGRLLDVRPGRWSWNRAHPDLSRSSMSWFREWPEALDTF